LITVAFAVSEVPGGSEGPEIPPGQHFRR
jgi:hypothetical protein